LCATVRAEYPAARVVVVKGVHGTYDGGGKEAGEITVELRAVGMEVGKVEF